MSSPKHRVCHFQFCWISSKGLVCTSWTTYIGWKVGAEIKAYACTCHPYLPRTLRVKVPQVPKRCQAIPERCVEASQLQSDQSEQAEVGIGCGDDSRYVFKCYCRCFIMHAICRVLLNNDVLFCVLSYLCLKDRIMVERGGPDILNCLQCPFLTCSL